MTTLKQLRLDRGMSRTEVAAAVGLSERHLDRLEAGTHRLRYSVALTFAAFYGVDVHDIDEADVNNHTAGTK